MAVRLKKKDITLEEVFLLSKAYYGKQIDDKKKRAKMDTVSGKVIKIKNFIYDPFTHSWKSSEKRHIKFEFIIKTRPISYKKIDTIPTHLYPVTFLLYDAELGIKSPFKWREGSFKKPLYVPKGSNNEKRIKITNANIRNGVDLHFHFSLEYVLKQFALLYGPCYANRLPTTANPKLNPYFGKHAWFIYTKILLRLLTGKNLSETLRKVHWNK